MRLNVELTKEIYEEMSTHAKRSGRGLSDIVRVWAIEWNAQQRRDERERELRLVPNADEPDEREKVEG